jgi:enoyl-CoA hydratase
MSSYAQFDLSLEEAMANEFDSGLAALEEETSSGAKRFAEGAGRHGSFRDSTKARKE